MALADLVKEIKTASSARIKGQNVFPAFNHWQDGYGAFTCSWRDRGAIIEYIKNQEQHHQGKTYREKYARLLAEADLAIDERDDPW